ncbi:MAG: hypothetical protein IH874_09615 [Candidatus Dadabacteria bacterium]|nr:hypothetical protein [Candidatus Dadabacteria bacterium]
MRKFVLGFLAVAFIFPASSAFSLEKKGTYSIHFGWFAVGKVYEIGKDHGFFMGEFSGTVFNDAGKGFLHHASVVCPGADDFIKGVSNAHGYCTITDWDGDQAYLVWKCKGSKGSPKSAMATSSGREGPENIPASKETINSTASTQTLLDRPRRDIQSGGGSGSFPEEGNHQYNKW